MRYLFRNILFNLKVEFFPLKFYLSLSPLKSSNSYFQGFQVSVNFRTYVINIGSYSKCTLLRKGGRGLMKKVTKSDLGGRVCSKKKCHSAKNFLCPFFFFFFFFFATHFFPFVSHKTLIISQRLTIKTYPRSYFCN